MKTDVTALVFSYNNAGEIMECLSSIARQSAWRRIHLIVHDDASADGTADIAERYLRSTSLSWSIVRNETNRYSAGIDFFRHVILSCETEFVALCDADDIWVSPNKIEVQLKSMAENPAITLSHHAYAAFEGKSGKDLFVVNRSDPNSDCDEGLFLYKNYVGACTAMFRLSALSSHLDWRGYEDLKVPDYALWGVASIQGKVHFEPELLSRYRVSDQSMSGRITYLGQRLASLETRRWLWFQFSLHSGLSSETLRNAWCALVSDWRVNQPRFWFETTRLVFRPLHQILNNFSPLRIWRLMALIQKIRIHSDPSRRD